MKLARTSRRREDPARGRAHQECEIMRLRNKSRERGIALVITLILLSIITFMAVAFLVLSRGQKSNVTTVMDQAQARMGADEALERAEADLLSVMIASGNESGYGM